MKVKEVLLSVIQNTQWTSLRVKDYIPAEKPVKLDRPMTIQEYTDWDGMVCPFCYGENLEWDYGEYGANDAYQEVYCMDCGAEWHDKYKLVGYVVVRHPSVTDAE